MHLRIIKGDIDANGKVNIKLGSFMLQEEVRSIRLVKYSFSHAEPTGCGVHHVIVHIPFIAVGVHQEGVAAGQLLTLPLNTLKTFICQSMMTDCLMLEPRIPPQFELALLQENTTTRVLEPFNPANAHWELNMWFDYAV